MVSHLNNFAAAIAAILFYLYIFLRQVGGFTGMFNQQIISRTQPLVIVSDLANLKPLPFVWSSVKDDCSNLPFTTVSTNLWDFRITASMWC